MADTDSLEIHVVAHTHWDREWYHPLGRFRQRLVALIDELLDDPPPFGESFLLDGQAIVLDDYFQVKPERRGEVAALLRESRLEAGPWYVLADELIPSGEALVRNLIAGHRALRALGAEPPPVLYCPDSFGHPATLPMLARGFGMGVVVLWRGYGGRRWPPGDTASWRAMDGSETLLFHLPPAGYEFGSSLPVDEDQVRVRWSAMRGVLARRSTLGILLVQNGADHHARQRAQREAVDALEVVAKPATLVRSSLARLAGALVERARSKSPPQVTGELRDSYGYTWALQGTFASRAAQKRRNARAERLLVREAEPWAVVAARAGGVARDSLLRAAWRDLLACHPHDTLCGCSIDPVARAMDARLTDVLAQARGIRDDAILEAIGHDRIGARDRRAGWRNVVVVRNSAARPRGGVVEVVVSEFVDDVRVGPGSAPTGLESRGPRSKRGDVSTMPALEHDGVALVMQRLGGDTEIELTESPLHYPDADRVRRTRALVWIPDIGGYGTHSLTVGEAAGARNTSAAAVLPNGVAPVSAGGDFIANDRLRVEWTDKGVRLVTADGRRISRLVALEDQHDAGDLYTPSLRGRVHVARFVDARVVHEGPLRAEVVTRWQLGDAPTVRISVSVDAGSSLVRLRVRGVNTERDHRLRIVIGTDVTHTDGGAGEVWADATFGSVRRERLDIPESDMAAERPQATAPLHRYVSRFDGERGATVFGDGLAEYEALDNGGVAVTLVRAVGELSRNDLPERPGHAGWPAHVPAAQSPGPFRASFALLLHAGDRTLDTVDAIERAADEFLLPLRGRSLRSALAIPSPTRGIELSGAGLAFSACKPSDDGGWTVLRCLNLTGETRDAEWIVGWPIEEARLSRFDERPVEPLPFEGSRVRCSVGPHAVTTILLR
jgi:alpha-mannosidase